MSKNTPGPWKVEGGGFVGGPVGFGHVCQLWSKYEEDFMNAEANARLIAVVPELLQFAKEHFDSTNCTCKFLGYIGKEPPCRRCKLGALIKKAEAE